MYAFERFTERAKRTLTLAQEEAQRRGHSYIGTEHLLLGLLRSEKSLAYRVLRNLGVELAEARETIDGLLAGQPQEVTASRIIPTARVKKVIETSFEEARRMGQKNVGTEYLLLGLVIDKEGLAAHVLLDLGVTPDRVRAEITRLAAGGSQEEWVSAPLSRAARPAHTELPFGPEARDLLRFASTLAAAEGAAAVGLEHLRRAMADPAVQSLLELAARVRQAGAERRQDEAQLRDEYERADAAWRASIQKPRPE